MSGPSRSGRPPASWLPYVGCASLAIGVVYQAGQLTSRIERNSERIVALEANDKVRTTTIENMNLRGARIEAKLDLIVPDRAQHGEAKP